MSSYHLFSKNVLVFNVLQAVAEKKIREMKRNILWTIIMGTQVTSCGAVNIALNSHTVHGSN